MDIIILAAGKGERLKPITNDIPKCMVPINDKPIIKHIYDNLIKACINIELQKINLYIISGYQEEPLIDYGRKNLGGAIFISQKYQDGTASAIELAEPYIKSDFVVLAGDTIYSVEDLEKILKNTNSFLYTAKHEDLERYGTLVLNEKGEIIKINEKKTAPKSNYINCSAYHFNKNIFPYIARTKKEDRFGERIITNSINLYLKDGNNLKGIYTENHYDVTFPEDVEKRERQLK
jgi:bifunctional UDP-N-acetylglucosamine pyrophosphorylase/glucosamine-1-phosphate N-acetyltransferase